MPQFSSVTFLMAPFASLMFQLAAVPVTSTAPPEKPGQLDCYQTKLNDGALLYVDGVPIGLAMTYTAGDGDREIAQSFHQENYVILKKERLLDLMAALKASLEREHLHDRSGHFLPDEQDAKSMHWSYNACRQLLNQLRAQEGI